MATKKRVIAPTFELVTKTNIYPVIGFVGMSLETADEFLVQLQSPNRVIAVPMEQVECWHCQESSKLSLGDPYVWYHTQYHWIGEENIEDWIAATEGKKA